MSENESLLYRLGYALERARSSKPARTGKRLAGLTERRAPDPERAEAAIPDTDALLASAAVAAISKALDLWRPRGRARPLRLFGALAAGAGAALVLELIRPLLRGGPVPGLDRATGDRLLAGATQGLLYGAAVEPRIPGPPILKGVVYGSVEYAVDPAGGLARLLGAHAPHRRVPLLADLVEGLEPHERLYLEHVLFGITLATLYGRSPSYNGDLEAEPEE